MSVTLNERTLAVLGEDNFQAFSKYYGVETIEKIYGFVESEFLDVVKVHNLARRDTVRETIRKERRNIPMVRNKDGDLEVYQGGEDWRSPDWLKRNENISARIVNGDHQYITYKLGAWIIVNVASSGFFQRGARWRTAYKSGVEADEVFNDLFSIFSKSLNVQKEELSANRSREK